MMKLKMEHGDDAIPISHKYVKEGGILNSRFFAREVVELTAAVQEKRYPLRRNALNKNTIDYTIDDAVNGPKKSMNTSVAAGHQETKERSVDTIARSIDDVNNNLNELKAQAGMETAAFSKKQDSPPKTEEKQVETGGSEGDSIDKFEKEFNEIKKALNKLVSERNSAVHNDIDSVVREGSALSPYFEILKNNEYDFDQCNSIVNEVKNTMSRDDLKDRYKIEKNLKDILKSKIVTTGPLAVSNKKKIIMFIGPTGVGKTTTMAKLGAIHSLREGNRVAFITIDNYRIAATEQLKKYSEIMRIPLHVVNSQKEFKEVLTQEKAEIIMVDTSGRSHRNEMKISEIKSFADLVEYDFEKVLCVSASTKKMDVSEVFKAFNTMEFNSIIITKVDETSYIGNVVDIADKYNKPISYVTNGQEVPNDIIVADPDKIVDMMIGAGNK